MGNFSSFKDNIKYKYEEINELNDIKNFIVYNCNNENRITISCHGYKGRRKMEVNASVIRKIIEKLIEFDEEMIEKYLKYSFETELRKQIEEERKNRNE